MADYSIPTLTYDTTWKPDTSAYDFSWLAPSDINNSFSYSPSTMDSMVYMDTIGPASSTDMFDSVIGMVKDVGEFFQENEALASFGSAAMGGLMQWSQNDITQDYYDQQMALARDKLNLSDEQFAQSLAIRQQMADAASMNAHTNRQIADRKEDQRQQHNAGISSYGSKYGRK